MNYGWLDFKSDLPLKLARCLNIICHGLIGKWFNLWNLSRLHNTEHEPCRIGSVISTWAWHTFTTFHKAKREARYNEGFHFSSYLNNSMIFWLKHNVCAKNITDRAIQTNCAPLDWQCCSYEAKREQYTLESVKCFLVCREEPSYLNTPMACKRTFREKAVVVVRKLEPYFFNKGDHELYFLCVLCGSEWHNLHCLHCLYLY